MKFIAIIGALVASTEAKKLSPWTPSQYTNFRIRMVRGKCLLPNASTGVVTLRECKGTSDELFYVNHETGAIHWAADATKILGASGDKATNWELAAVRLYDENRVDAEIWYDQHTSTLHPKGNQSYCLDNYYGDYRDKGPVGWWNCHNGLGQQWYFEPVTHVWDNNQDQP